MTMTRKVFSTLLAMLLIVSMSVISLPDIALASGSNTMPGEELENQPIDNCTINEYCSAGEHNINCPRYIPDWEMPPPTDGNDYTGNDGGTAGLDENFSLDGGGGTTGGTGSQGGSNHSMYGWVNVSYALFSQDSINYKNKNSAKLRFSAPKAGGSYGERTFNTSVYGQHTYWAGYLGYQHKAYGGEEYANVSNVIDKNGGVAKFKLYWGATDWNYLGGWVSNAGGAHIDDDNNWRSGYRIHPFFLNNSSYCGPLAYASTQYYGRLYWANGGVLTSVYIDSNAFSTTQTYDFYKDVIVSVDVEYDDPEDDPNNDPDNNEPTGEFDDSDKPDSELYYHGNTGGGYYYGVTPPGDTDKSHQKLVIKVKRIHRSVTVTTKLNDIPSKTEVRDNVYENGDYNHSFKWTNVRQTFTSQPYVFTKDINTNFNSPVNTQYTFTPFNLNRTDIAQVGDNGYEETWSGNQVNKGALDLEINTPQNRTDNLPMDNAVDINNDTPFTVNMNGSLGMKDTYTWGEVPPSDALNKTAENGTKYGDIDLYKGYANELIGDTTELSEGITGYYRYNIRFNGSITGTMTVDGSKMDIASLVKDDDEKTSSEALTGVTDVKDEEGNIYKYTGGDYSARFILADTYTLDNEDENSPDSMKRYWIAKYDQDRFYEYGVKYYGSYTIDQSNVTTNKPPIVNITEPKRNYSVGGLQGFTITTINDVVNSGIVMQSTSNINLDGLTQRGIYLGKVSRICYQPIVTGTWVAKTLAGDTRN